MGPSLQTTIAPTASACDHCLAPPVCVYRTCREWIYPCDLHTSIYVISGVMVALLILTLLTYFALLLLGKRELERRPYAQFRQHNIELHLQVGGLAAPACLSACLPALPVCLPGASTGSKG